MACVRVGLVRWLLSLREVEMVSKILIVVLQISIERFHLPDEFDR